LRDELRLVQSLQLTDMPPDRLRVIIARATVIAEKLEHDGHEHQRELLSILLKAITLCPDLLRLEIKQSGLMAVLAETGLSFHPTDGLIDLSIPVQLKRRGVEAKLVMRAAAAPFLPEPKLIMVIANAHRWIDDLVAGRASSIRDLARRNGRDPGEVSRTLPLAFLAPDIIEAILAGRQPIELTPRKLKQIGTLPSGWDAQRRCFGLRA
jgi:hypothetical protein